ncbi:MAG: alpha/beta hydrolase family protein [Blastocatellales bacterium]
MRPLEWAFLLSFLPALLLPYFSFSRQRRRWLVFAALLPLIAGLPHLALEGWRAQMIPLYALAMFVGVTRLYTLRAKGAEMHKPGRFTSSLLFLAIVIGGLLPGWLLPVISLPEPTGPYKVGIVDRELVDKARGRRLMASVWYPAAQSGIPAKLTNHPEAIVSGLARSFGLPVAAPFLQHLRYFKVAASNAVPAATGAAPFPILVFSHGLVGTRIQNSSTVQELASWGYVVVALDHTDAAAVTVFPDGETRLYDLQRLGISPAEIENSTKILLPIWVADQRFVYDALESWAADDPLLTGKLDLQRIGSFGHSFGGATALEVCRVEPRCRAAANLDGGINSSDGSKAAIRPFLLMTSTASNELPEPIRDWSRLVEDAPGPAYWVELPGSSHYSFTIAPLLSPLLRLTGSDARASLRTVDKYLRAFFDLHLCGVSTPLLDPASGETDVRWHSKQ